MKLNLQTLMNTTPTHWKLEPTMIYTFDEINCQQIKILNEDETTFDEEIRLTESHK
jgi:hypothetical protein